MRELLTYLPSSLLLSRAAMMAMSNSLSLLVRGLSTSAARPAAMVKAPIQVFGVAGRYATALYSAASKEKKLDAVEKDLNALQGVIDGNTNLQDLLKNPIITRAEKKSVVLDVLKEQKASPLVTNLVDLLGDNNRLGVVSGVAKTFSDIMSAHRGEVICEVTTAKALDAGTMKSLQDALKMFLKKGETLKLNTKVDPALIGGMVVNVGDRFVDMSTASKINRMAALIRQPL
ncbi:ATP5O [Branchiostoma lanceolatum]|uniref:ATP synthase peripheral stalk subunit OSCP, mitochondrial n=2 Tax=Branchiostoma lanceolatum TaxID=7740 RepID=A0A8J9VX73_BRALA|nr:ATP5O [Branchiostoma lanceolatum]